MYTLNKTVEYVRGERTVSPFREFLQAIPEAIQSVTRLALRFCRSRNRPMTGDGEVNDERRPNDSDITGLFARGAQFIQEIPGRDRLHHWLG